MTLPDRNHVMLSYDRKNQYIVSKVYDILKTEDILVWYDIEESMENNLYKRLSEGIENASIVCCFISPEYQECDQCKLELEYAQIRHKQIIPCIVTEKLWWKPSDWLEAITAELAYVDLKDDSEDNISLKTEELIDRIKKDDATLKPVSEATYLIELAKYEYKRNVHIQRIMNPTKSFHIKDSFFNLTTVHSKEKADKEKQLRGSEYSDVNMSSYEQIYTTKTIIELIDIFKTCKNQMKQALVLGRAGIGKSTFCRYAVYQWAAGSCLQQYELVAFIPLHHLTTKHYPSNKNYSFIDLIEKEVFHSNLSEKDKTYLKKLLQTNRILWVLDGYDEIIQHIPDHLQNLFKQLLQTQTHILTSRPYLYTLSYDVQTELIGFTDTNIQNYIQNFFNQMEDETDNASVKSEALWKFLHSNRLNLDIVRIPVNLELICSIWSTGELSDKNQLTITALYTMMTDWLCHRYLTSFDKQFVQLSKEELDERCHKELAMLERLAFIAMKNNIIIIDSSLLKKTMNEATNSYHQHSNLLNIGILKSFNQSDITNSNETNMNYWFVHYSFQEYFAARYLTNLLKGSLSSSSKEAIDFIKHEKYNERYVLVFSFMSGLLNDMNAKPCLNTFWDSILGEPMDLVGVREMQLVISCMEEVTDKSNIPRYAELIDCIGQCIKYNVSKEISFIHKHLSQSLQRAQTIACHPTILNVLIDLLETDNSSTTIEVLYFISELRLSNPSSVLVSAVTDALDSKTDYTRWYACEALGKINENALTDEAIRKLANTLGDENGYVRMNACEVLSRMSEKAVTDEVISGLISVLRDDYEDIRTHACKALVNFGETAAADDVITALVNALGHENLYIRWYACYVLAKLGTQSVSNKVTDKLMNVLDHENTNLKKHACLTLGMIGDKLVVSEVINNLVTALKDTNKNIRCYACEVFGEMGEEVVTDEVISKLVRAIADDNETVRQNASEALGKLGGKAATDEVVNKLITLLEDENIDVTRNACKALGKIGRNAATTEMISKLVNALGDKNVFVRMYACEVLGYIGEKAATNQVISKLQHALEDKNDVVRGNACEALGKMGEKAATKEVIANLLEMLDDKNTGVTMKASEALSMMGKEAAKKELIITLVNALRNDYAYVRVNACQALTRISERATTIEVANELMRVLDDENPDVRRCAWETLGIMDEKVATSEVISRLVSALTDQSAYVRMSACRILGKMGQKAATNEVLKKLVNAIDDENIDVRKNACDTLKIMGEKLATDRVISMLVTVLDNGSASARMYACQVLGNLGPKAGTTEVISRLADALEAQYLIVTINACETLGKIGPKAATMEIISRLAPLVKNMKWCDKNYAEEALENILSSSAPVTQLGPEIIADLCLCDCGLKCLENLSEEQLITMFVTTEKPDWLLALGHFMLRERIVVTNVKEKRMIYSRSQAVELHVPKPLLWDQIEFVLTDQRKRVSLSIEKSSEVKKQAQSSSGFCNIL